MSSTNHQWHWIPIIDPSWCKCLLYPPPVQCENYSISHKLETDQPKQKKKKVSRRIYFYTFILVLDLKIKKQMAENLDWTFLTSVKLALNSQANSSEVTYLKIQNRLSRPPQATPTDWFLMQYLNNKCALFLHESVKKVVLNFRQPVAPQVFWIGKQIGPWLSLGTSPPKTKSEYPGMGHPFLSKMWFSETPHFLKSTQTALES